MAKGLGVTTSVVIHTRTKKHKQNLRKKDALKEKRAKVCISCTNNNEGFCGKYKAWCSRANVNCN